MPKRLILVYLNLIFCSRLDDDTAHSLQRLVTWIEDPKSADVRRAAQSVVRAMMEVSPSQFFTILPKLPDRQQVGIRKLCYVIMIWFLNALLKKCH